MFSDAPLEKGTLGPMKILPWMGRFICGTVILIVGIYTTIAICVAGFIVLGRLTPGQVMIFDTNTPTLIQTLIVVAIGSLVIAACVVIRGKLVVQPSGPGDGPRPGDLSRT